MRGILASLNFPVARDAKKYHTRTEQTEWLKRLTVCGRSRSVFRFRRADGGHDDDIFLQKTVAAVVDFIPANPVRRGLVGSPRDWAWSSARFWDGCRDVPLIMDHPET